MTYTETVNAFAAAVGEQMSALFDRLAAGEITGEQFVALATALLTRAAAQGVALADLGLASTLSVQRDGPVPALGLAVPEDKPGALAVVAGALLAAEATRDAAAVTGRAETLAASQDAFGEGLRAHGVQSWTRVLNGGACELCRALAGPILPASTDMYHHKGCGCSQRPIEEG